VPERVQQEQRRKGRGCRKRPQHWRDVPLRNKGEEDQGKAELHAEQGGRTHRRSLGETVTCGSCGAEPLKRLGSIDKPPRWEDRGSFDRLRSSPGKPRGPQERKP